MNVSSGGPSGGPSGGASGGLSGGAQRAVPQALILALLVGGTGAFLVEESHAADADRVTEAADVLPDGAVEAAGQAAHPGSGPGAGEAAPVAPRSVETLVLPHAPGPPAAPQLPSRPRHARPRHRAAEEVRPADVAEYAANRGRHRATSPLVRFGTGALDWSALARCESGGNPHITDPSGRYGGLYQFDAHTWHSLGGRGLPQNASAAEQTSRAAALFHARGTSPWPACGPRAER